MSRKKIEGNQVNISGNNSGTVAGGDVYFSPPTPKEPDVKMRIFLSYRRIDEPDIAGRICDNLEHSYGAGSVFKDIYSINPGTNFPTELYRALLKCNVLVAVIGNSWNPVEGGQHKFQNPDDWIRQEIEAALNENITILPVLINTAQYPPKDQLSDVMRQILRIQTLTIRSGDDFRSDVEKLRSAIDELKGA